jgi:hypothetical protein
LNLVAWLFFSHCLCSPGRFGERKFREEVFHVRGEKLSPVGKDERRGILRQGWRKGRG